MVNREGCAGNRGRCPTLWVSLVCFSLVRLLQPLIPSGNDESNGHYIASMGTSSR